MWKPAEKRSHWDRVTTLGWNGLKIAGWGSYHPHPVGPVGGHPGLPMKFHDGGGGVMAGYHHHNLMDMYPGPAINTMDWKNTSQVCYQEVRPA